MSTYMPKASDISRKWYVLDADGVALGRVAAKAAHILRGKHKPTFAPHVITSYSIHYTKLYEPEVSRYIKEYLDENTREVNQGLLL